MIGTEWFKQWGKHCLRGLALLLLMASLLFPSATSLADGVADETVSPSTPPPTELNATDIPSEKVDQFVSAYLNVAQLLEDRAEDLQRAETETASAQLTRAIEGEAFALIQEAGLTRQDYFQLLGLANTDPEFRDRVLAQLEETDS